MAGMTRGDNFRNWTAFVLSIAAFIFSGVTTYYTTLSQVDDLRLIISKDPSPVFVDKTSNRVTIDGISFLLINMGTRPIAVTHASLIAGAKHGRDCSGTRFKLDTHGVVVDQKKIVEVVAKSTQPTIAVPGVGDAMAVCLELIAATPSNPYIFKQEYLFERHFSGQEWPFCREHLLQIMRH